MTCGHFQSSVVTVKNKVVTYTENSLRYHEHCHLYEIFSQSAVDMTELHNSAFGKNGIHLFSPRLRDQGDSPFHSLS
jgi:hypothetical protein